MTTSPQSRIQVLNVPVAAPGKCVMCGSSNGEDRTFLDFGFAIDWYGVVYFCSECIKEFAQAINYIPVEAFQAQDRELNALQVTYDKLVKEHSVTKDALCTLLSSDSAGDRVSFPLDNVEDAIETVETSRGDDEGTEKTTEPSSIEGPDDFFDPDDFGN